MEQGYVHVYTGNGKGKTTAAVGVAVRAAGAGLRVWIGQFLKGRNCSEHKALEKFKPLVEVERFGDENFITSKPDQRARSLAKDGLERARVVLQSKEYDLVILDEAAVAVYFNLFDISLLLNLLDSRPKETEMIITGRNAPQELIDRADLVTEMREIKHYYTRNVISRPGIEE